MNSVTISSERVITIIVRISIIVVLSLEECASAVHSMIGVRFWGEILVICVFCLLEFSHG